VTIAGQDATTVFYGLYVSSLPLPPPNATSIPSHTRLVEVITPLTSQTPLRGPAETAIRPPAYRPDRGRETEDHHPATRVDFQSALRRADLAHSGVQEPVLQGESQGAAEG
jgi:hypothetical protein